MCDLSDTVLPSKHWFVTIRQGIWGFVPVLREQRRIPQKEYIIWAFPFKRPCVFLFFFFSPWFSAVWLWKPYSSKVPLHLQSLVPRLMLASLRGQFSSWKINPLINPVFTQHQNTRGPPFSLQNISLYKSPEPSQGSLEGKANSFWDCREEKFFQEARAALLSMNKQRNQEQIRN